MLYWTTGVALISLFSSCAALRQCIYEGKICANSDEYIFNHKIEYNVGHLDLSYDFGYPISTFNHSRISVLLYHSRFDQNFTEQRTCMEKLRWAQHTENNMLIVLTEEKYWSGCKIHANRLTCLGGRSFGTPKHMSFRLAVLRCGADEINLDYQLTYDGAFNACEDGQLIEEEDGLSRNWIIVTGVCIANSALLLFVFTYCVCRKVIVKRFKKTAEKEIQRTYL